MADVWLHGWLDDDHPRSLALAAQLSVNNVVVGPSQEDAEAVRQAGLRPWVSIGAFSAAEDEEDLLCRSLSGAPLMWFRSGCPNNPALRERLLHRLHELASWDIEGIFLDGIRFASSFEGADTFFTCTCRWCEESAAELGLSLTEMASSLAELVDDLARLRAEDLEAAGGGLLSPIDGLPLALTYPGVMDWLRFRALSILEAVSQVRTALERHAPRQELAAYLFTPALAPLVGQDYTRLAPHLDIISPMIYRFGDGPACLPAEVTGLASFFREANRNTAIQISARFLGLETALRPGQPLEEGMAIDALSREARRARARLGRDAKLVPILWLDDPNILAATAAVQAGLPDGVSFFATGTRRGEHLQAAAAYLGDRGG